MRRNSHILEGKVDLFRNKRAESNQSSHVINRHNSQLNLQKDQSLSRDGNNSKVAASTPNKERSSMQGRFRSKTYTSNQNLAGGGNSGEHVLLPNQDGFTKIQMRHKISERMIVVHEDQREEAASPIKRKIKVIESTHSKRRKSCMSGELSGRKRRNSDSNGDR